MNKNRLRAILTAVISTLSVIGIVFAVPHIIKTNTYASTVNNTATIIPRKPYPSNSNYTPSPIPNFSSINVMSVGDSLTVGTDATSPTTSYRGELSRLMYKTGQTHQWHIEAVGGTKCSYWAERMGTLIDTYHPDIVFLNCGTNDTPTDNTEADYRTILEAATSRNKQIVASLIGIPDMQTNVNRARPYIIDWMHNTNLAIKRALVDYPQVPVADFQQVPHNIEWLQTDGIHLTGRSEVAYGQIFYQAIQPLRGWLTFSQMKMHEICGLNGSWIDDPEPIPDVDYRPCRNE